MDIDSARESFMIFLKRAQKMLIYYELQENRFLENFFRLKKLQLKKFHQAKTFQ